MIKVTTDDGFVHTLQSVEAIANITSINTRNALLKAVEDGNSKTYTPPEPESQPPTPDWDGFTAILLADVRLNAVLSTVLAVFPAVSLGVTVALGQVAKEGVSAFAIAFPALCTLGSATVADRAAWALLAEASNLPSDFVAIVRG